MREKKEWSLVKFNEVCLIRIFFFMRYGIKLKSSLYGWVERV